MWCFGSECLALYIIAEDVRPPEQPQTQLVLEQPEDPARYRDPEDVAQNKYFSNFRTSEWLQVSREVRHPTLPL